jgi:response regulator RpfG family c-di-GMP phosphodiesterase
MINNKKILFVDDDQNILDSFRRNLYDTFDVVTALSGEEGLKAIETQGPFAVIVSDYRMPVMDGIKFLSEALKLAPDTIRIMLTGHADLQAAIDAVNEGNLFRFLLKPCPHKDLLKTIYAGIEQYRLVTAEKELLEKTLHGSIKVLSDILSIVNPIAFSHSARARSLATKIAKRLKLDNLWEVEIAAMLSQIGCVTIPTAILKKKYSGQQLAVEQEEMYLEHPLSGRNLLKNIPRLEKVAEGIIYQEKRYDGGGVPEDGIKGEQIPVLGRILKVVLDYDLLKLNGNSDLEAFNTMKARSQWYDPVILKALEEECFDENRVLEVKEIRIEELLIGMTIAEDILSKNGVLLVPGGQEISEALKQRLLNYRRFSGIKEPIKIFDSR